MVTLLGDSALPDVQVGQLRAERARYERALRREVGEDVPLQKVLDEASDWRGRAQHIVLLQERLLSAQESQARPIPRTSTPLDWIHMPVPQGHAMSFGVPESPDEA